MKRSSTAILLATCLTCSVAGAQTPAAPDYGSEPSGDDARTEPAAGADADTPTNSDTHSLVRIGLRFSAGAAIIGTPDDEAGSETLLYGTGFTGSAIGAAVTLAVCPLPWLRIGTELDFVTHSMNGYAEDADSGARRDLTLGFRSLYVPLHIEFGAPLGPIELRAAVGLGARIGLGTNYRESFEDLPEDETPFVTEKRSDLVGHIESGLAIPIGRRVTIPLLFRATHNFGYPNTSAERLRTAAVGGIATQFYDVEADWTLSASIALELHM